MNYTAIHIQGNIISGEILDKIRTEDNYPYQSPRDFGAKDRLELRDQINAAWAQARQLWEMYQDKVQRLAEGDTGTSIARRLWIIPLLMDFGYELDSATAEEHAGRSFSISHRAAKRDNFPVLIMGNRDPLDRKPAGNRLRVSPHALMQEYLNYTEHLYGIVTNGYRLRLLRDSNRLAKLAFLEFDLESMMTEELYHEFALMYRLIHISRMPETMETAEKAIIEGYHQESIATGARVRDKLRDSVKQSMEILATGFLGHPANRDLLYHIENDNIKAKDFYRLLLRVMYRIIFIATIEDRGLIFPKSAGKDEAQRTRRAIYLDFYSLEHLRNLSLAPIYVNPHKTDLWKSLLSLFRLFEPGLGGEKLGIAPLGGELFRTGGLSEGALDFYSLELDNQSFLDIFRGMTTFVDDCGHRSRVNYRDLDVEELGSIYEALLELHPYFRNEGRLISFGFTAGSEQKATGSYYTRHDLVAQLLKSALIPVMEDRLKARGWSIEKLRGDKLSAEKALLEIKVCDPAAGSGHFLLGAARLLGFELARIRSGEDNPGEEYYLPALRDVIENCIYGVDLNPEAVELCRMSLWLVAHNPGKPLTFLDHKIRCGNSLVGIDKLERLYDLIPAGAFSPLTDDNNTTASAFKRANTAFLRSGQYSLIPSRHADLDELQEHAKSFSAVANTSVGSIIDYEEKRKKYENWRHQQGSYQKFTACNLYTWAFFQPYPQHPDSLMTVTSETLQRYLNNPADVHPRLVGMANAAEATYHFFHWPLEFPDVFSRGGFDVLLGNPPWERIKLQETEFFGARDPGIAKAANASIRKAMIKELVNTNPALYQEYQKELHTAEATSRFIRSSGRFPLAGRGDINVYGVFAEHFAKMCNTKGRNGIVVPTGIATDDTYKFLFADMVDNRTLVSLFDFENKKQLFPIHRSYKFCLLTTSGGAMPASYEPQFAFFLHDVLDLQDERRVFTLTKEDFARINPNTKTCPIFRTRHDAELTKKIYSYVPVLINEEKNQNPWGVKFLRMFDMSNDSHLFRTREQMEEAGFTLMGNRFVKGEPPFTGQAGEMWLPLYESKMIWQYDHRFGTYQGIDSRSSSSISTPTTAQHQDPAFLSMPWYWVSEDDVIKQHKTDWLIGFRDITNTTNERTSIFAGVGRCGVGNNMPLILSNKPATSQVLLLANFNSIILDFFARQKIAGTHMNFFYVEQFVMLPKECYDDLTDLLVAPIVELMYTSWDLKPFFDAMWIELSEKSKEVLVQAWVENKESTGGNPAAQPSWAKAFPEFDTNETTNGIPFPPFKWDNLRREKLLARLDAVYALMYGLEKEEVLYLLNPKVLLGDNFPGETFRVLKEKELRRHGEFRTSRLILEAYDDLRSGWEMEAHKKRMKDIWEKYQIDLSENQPEKHHKARKKKTQSAGGYHNDAGGKSGRVSDKKVAYGQQQAQFTFDLPVDGD